MTIQDLIDQFEIQGIYTIKAWDDSVDDCVILNEGNDFELDKWNMNEEILNKKVTYMYAIDSVLYIEVELN